MHSRLLRSILEKMPRLQLGDLVDLQRFHAMRTLVEKHGLDTSDEVSNFTFELVFLMEGHESTDTVKLETLSRNLDDGGNGFMSRFVGFVGAIVALDNAFPATYEDVIDEHPVTHEPIYAKRIYDNYHKESIYYQAVEEAAKKFTGAAAYLAERIQQEARRWHGICQSRTQSLEYD